MTGWPLTSSMPAMMRCFSSCFDVTRMWRNTERANLEKKPSTEESANTQSVLAQDYWNRSSR